MPRGSPAPSAGRPHLERFGPARLERDSLRLFGELSPLPPPPRFHEESAVERTDHP
jgi:hypothetical protein